jgi:type IV pilus assembly protein PilC
MKFKYWARTKEGKVQSGIIEASSRDAALEVLKSHDLYITGLEAADAVPFYAKKINLFEKVSAVDLVMFSRQLAVMFTSGVPLAEALMALAGQTKKEKFKEKIVKLAQEIEGGMTFSKSLSVFPDLFSNFYVSVVRSGEVSGTLGKSLEYLANHLERDHNLKSRLKGAMIYPALVVSAVVGVFVLMTVFIIPQLTSVLEGSQTEPPAITKAAMALSYFMRDFWWLILLAAVGIGVGLWFYFRTEKGRSLKDKVLLKIPWISTFLKKIYLTQFAENLSTLISGGLPIGQALEVAGGILGNVVYRKVILEARDRVTRGESITTVFSEYPDLFTPLFIQMSLVGEKTGHIDSTIMTVADFYEEEINRITENLVNIIEPVLILVLGGMVGLLMAAVVIPLYQISAGSL